MTFSLLVCKFGGVGVRDCHITRANNDYTRVICEHLVSSNSFISHGLALRTVTPRVLAVKRTQLDQTGDNTAIHHCAPRDSVSFHSDSKACKLTQTHRVVVQRVQMCSRGTHESIAIKWLLVCVGAKGFIASAIVL